MKLTEQEFKELASQMLGKTNEQKRELCEDYGIKLRTFYNYLKSRKGRKEYVHE